MLSNVCPARRLPRDGSAGGRERLGRRGEIRAGESPSRLAWLTPPADTLGEKRSSAFANLAALGVKPVPYPPTEHGRCTVLDPVSIGSLESTWTSSDAARPAGTRSANKACALQCAKAKEVIGH